MNRIQFFVLTGLSSLLFLLLVGNILLSLKVSNQQIQTSQIQQALSQGQTISTNLRQLAIRLYTDAQKTGDPGLKDLLTRQQISFKANDTTGAGTGTPADASNTTPAPAAK
jgi:uncharacterized protein YpmS